MMVVATRETLAPAMCVVFWKWICVLVHGRQRGKDLVRLRGDSSSAVVRAVPGGDDDDAGEDKSGSDHGGGVFEFFRCLREPQGAHSWRPRQRRREPDPGGRCPRASLFRGDGQIPMRARTPAGCLGHLDFRGNCRRPAANARRENSCDSRSLISEWVEWAHASK